MCIISKYNEKSNYFYTVILDIISYVSSNDIPSLSERPDSVFLGYCFKQHQCLTNRFSPTYVLPPTLSFITLIIRDGLDIHGLVARPDTVFAIRPDTVYLAENLISCQISGWIPNIGPNIYCRKPDIFAGRISALYRVSSQAYY